MILPDRLSECRQLQRFWVISIAVNGGGPTPRSAAALRTLQSPRRLSDTGTGGSNQTAPGKHGAAQCVELVGKAGPTAELLYRIAYWQPKASSKDDGLRWIAKIQAEWLEETGLARNQVERAFAWLENRG